MGLRVLTCFSHILCPKRLFAKSFQIDFPKLSMSRHINTRAGIPQLKDPLLFRQSAFLNGNWVKSISGKTFLVFDPATDKEIGQAPEMDVEDTQIAIKVAREAFKGWAGQTAKYRHDLLMTWYSLMMEHQKDLALILTLENGKPLSESLGEIKYGASFIEWFAEEARRTYGDIIPAPIKNQRFVVQKQAVGVVGIITPWNFPNAMITRKIGAAIAAGCTVVIKPAPETPFSALAIVELANRAGIPKGVINVVTTHENQKNVGLELTTNPNVKKITFTGSTQVGRLLMQQSSSTLKKITLELGGNAPFIVFDDADLESAVEGAITSKFRSTGQTCVSPNRIFIQSSIHAEFASRLAQRVAGFRVGDGLNPETTHGPLINHKAIEKCLRHVEDAISKGAEILVGGTYQGGNFFDPTVITGIKPGMLIDEEETFGPIAGLYKFDTEEEVIEMANSTESGLAGYFYSRDVGRCWRVAEALEVGMVGINCGLVSACEAPFGGESTSKAPFYGIAFNPQNPRDDTVFAAVGGRKIIIFSLRHPSPGISRTEGAKILQLYEDEHVQENFYCCAWSFKPTTGAPWLAAAGASGLVKILDTSSRAIIKVLAGHGDEINDLKFHPKSPSLLLSASKDFSIRLWNVETARVIAVFGGEYGHREPVLSIDFHLSGDYIASGGMDHAAKIWSLCSPPMRRAIEVSFVTKSSTNVNVSSPSRSIFKHQVQSCICAGAIPENNPASRLPVFVHFPLFSTTGLHNNYVDCVRWYGDLLLSRCATETRIILWKALGVNLVEDDNVLQPISEKGSVVGGPAIDSKRPANFDIICEFPFLNCNIWFLRFGLSPDHLFLATGNQIGKIYIWDLKNAISHYIEQYINEKKKIAHTGITKTSSSPQQSSLTQNSKGPGALKKTSTTSDSSSVKSLQLKEEIEEQDEKLDDFLANFNSSSVTKVSEQRATKLSTTSEKIVDLTPNPKGRGNAGNKGKGTVNIITPNNRRKDTSNQGGVITNNSSSKRLRKQEVDGQNHTVMRMLEVEKNSSVIRQIAFSKDGAWMVGVSDDSKIWCWHRSISIGNINSSTTTVNEVLLGGGCEISIDSNTLHTVAASGNSTTMSRGKEPEDE
ncbi:hypothetical protein G9A89_023908 [Geosiphon pyriformis]|nr:hypothetical protein G9A89_023908 [Geosiphon pyriformis]